MHHAFVKYPIGIMILHKVLMKNGWIVHLERYRVCIKMRS